MEGLAEVFAAVEAGDCAEAVWAALVDRPPVPPPAGGRPPPQGGRTRTFRLLFVAGALMSFALFSAFAFVVPFAKDRGIDGSSAALLVSVVGAASVTGRLVLSGASRWVGSLRLFQICLAVQPLAYLVWLVSDGSYGLLVLFAIILGASYGGYVALSPTVAAELFGVAGLGGLLGALFFGSALGGLFGPPIAGAVDDATDGQALPIAVALVVTVAASLVAFAVRPGDTVQPAAAEQPAPAAGRGARSSRTLAEDAVVARRSSRQWRCSPTIPRRSAVWLRWSTWMKTAVSSPTTQPSWPGSTTTKAGAS